jgi:hypothetical protein
MDNLFNIFEKFSNLHAPGYSLSYAKKYKATIAGMKKALGEARTLEEAVAYLDQYVNTRRAQKKSAREIVLAFYEYRDKNSRRQGKTWSARQHSTLSQTKVFDSPLLRNLEILKFLHGRSSTSAQIAEHFQIDERTARRSINALQRGITVFSVEIKLQEESRTGHERAISYHSTVHPLFLALNLTEVFALLRLLRNAGEETQALRGFYQELIDDIQAQLSPYARDVLSQAGISLADKPKKSQYRNEKTGVRSWLADTLLYLLKSGKEISLTYHDQEDKFIAVNGRIKNIERNTLYLRLDNGEIRAIDLSAVVIDLNSVPWS